MDDGLLDKLAPALVSLQADLVPVEKSAANPFFKSKYAPHPEVRKALQPLLAKHKLALIDVPDVIDGTNGLRFMLIHESGQYIQGQWKLTPAKHDPQGEGSDVTYKRRYGEMAMTGTVADEDDDGSAASPPNKPASEPSAAPQGSPTRVPTKKQLDFAYNLLIEQGYGDQAIKERLAKVSTAEEASELIEKLKDGA